MTTQTQSSQDSWQSEELKQLGMALTFAYKTQTTYKEALDLDIRLSGWRFVLEEDYSVEQVLYGLKQYMKTNKNMPVPADINNILNPEPPKITTAQYVSAQKWQERNQDWSEFTDAAETIVNYNKQENEAQDNFQIECTKIAQIVKNSVKRIEG